MNNLRVDVRSVEKIKADVSTLKADVQSLKNDVLSMQMTLENETNKNIRIIAKSHCNLSNKLDDAMRVGSANSRLNIRINSLENEVRKLKAQINATA